MTVTIPEEMTAAYVTKTGPADAIRVGSLPVPAPGPTDVLVRMIVTAVNHVDTFIRSGRYRTPLPMPFIIGRDLVGSVVAAGPGVSGPQIGDLVWCNSLGHGGRQGSFAEYAIVAADRLYPVPPNVSAEAVVAVAHPAATAYLGLFREARLRMGETVFVGGGAGGVGSAAVQLAHAAGARVVASASAADADWVRDCGAEQVFDYHDPILTDRIKDAAPAGIDVHLETSGRHDLDATVGLMAKGGRILLISAVDAHPSIPLGALYTRDISLHGFVISNATAADLAAAAGTINTLLSRGSLTGRVGMRLDLRDAAHAHRLLEDPPSDAPPGRIVLAA